MKSFFNKILKKSPETNNTSTQKPEKEDGKLEELPFSFFFKPRNFELDHLISLVIKTLEKEGFIHCKRFIIEELTIINYIKAPKKDASCYQLILKEENQELQYEIQQSTWIEDTDTISLAEKKTIISSLLGDSKEKEISKTIFGYITSLYQNLNNIDFDSRYIENMSLTQQSTFYSMTERNDTLLSFLEISSLQKLHGEKPNSEKVTWFYILSLDACYLIAFDSNERIQNIIDLSESSIEVKQEIGRDTVSVKDHQWLTTLSNDNLFVEISKANKVTDLDRLRYVANANWLNDTKDTKSDLTAFRLLEQITSITNSPFDQLTKLYIQSASDNRKTAFNENDFNINFVSLLKEIASEQNYSSSLSSWIKKWELSCHDTLQLVYGFLIADFSKDVHDNLLYLHRDIRNKYLETKPKEVLKLITEIQFAKHLVFSELKEEASILLKGLLDSLPDETLNSLLPDHQTDLTDEASGQVLRTIILDLLIKAVPEEDTFSYRLQVTQLHALNIDRIQDLINHSSDTLKTRAQEIEKVLTNDVNWDLTINEESKKLLSLSKDLLSTSLPHPASIEGGIFSNMQSWLANVPLPDYSSLKEYAERLSSLNYEEHAHFVTDIKHAMNVDNLEVYVVRGNKALGVECFESDPPFMTIGINHLTEDSVEYLNLEEFKHVIGSEIAHLYYKHTRITSNDVWRGAKDKGIFVLDTFLSIIPAVGFLGNSIKNISKLGNVATVLQKTTNIGDWADKGKSVLEYSETALGIFKKKNELKDEDRVKEQEMLLTSRIMQLTADRAGLLFSGNIVKSITAVLKNSTTYRPHLDTVKRYGISSLTLKKDEHDDFIYQDLTIRLVSLFSFYLSNDYITLRENLQDK